MANQPRQSERAFDALHSGGWEVFEFKFTNCVALCRAVDQNHTGRSKALQPRGVVHHASNHMQLAVDLWPRRPSDNDPARCNTNPYLHRFACARGQS